jgi:hypothetical protein
MLEMLPLPEDGGAKEQRWEIVWRLRARLSVSVGWAVGVRLGLCRCRQVPLK